MNISHFVVSRPALARLWISWSCDQGLRNVIAYARRWEGMVSKLLARLLVGDRAGRLNGTRVAERIERGFRTPTPSRRYACIERGNPPPACATVARRQLGGPAFDLREPVSASFCGERARRRR
ncbi:hypothetical protein MRX96_006489 [Rhipicephalus microplus]